MMFAQSTDLPAVPAETLKWVLIILSALLFIGLAIYAAWKSSQREAVRIDDNPPPEFRKAAKRFNYELCVAQHRDMERRVTDLENWRINLVKKMDDDKSEMLAAGEERASRIHAHIESDRRQIDLRLDAMPDRIIATLKNTGAIGD